MHAPLVAALLLSSLLAGDPPAPPPPTLQDARRALAGGDAPGAATLLEALTALEPGNGPAWALLGAARLQAGDRKGALAAYDSASGIPAVAPVALYNAACIRAGAGEKDPAFDLLRRARTAGFGMLGLLQRDPDLDPLRGDARFDGLLPSAAENSALFREKPRVLRVIYGEDAGDAFGWIGRAAGDVDGDGVPDFLLTAPFRPASGPPALRGAGRVYVHSGRTGREILHVDGEPGEFLGASVTEAGDVDGDGRPDILAGAPRWGGGTGSAHLISGKTGRSIRTLASGVAGDRFGDRVAAAGDLDGDGVMDHLVGAPGPSGGAGDPGTVHAFSGKDGRLLWTLRGSAPGEGFGSALAGDPAGGSRLVVVGVEDGGKERRGRVLVHRGGARGAELLFTAEASATGRSFGKMFASVPGDFDGDGTRDVYVSDWEDEALGPRTGSARILSGKDGKVLRSWTGEAAGEGFGIGAGLGGDPDGDGRPEVIIGAFESGAGAAKAGRVALYAGKDGGILRTWTSLAAGDTFGFDAEAVGDLDGDGSVDYLVTAAYAPVPGPKTGRAFVLAGEK